MHKKLSVIIISILLISFLITFSSALVGCKSQDGGDYESEIFAKVTAAATTDERQEALQAITIQCRSLGFVDPEGKQLNPNVASDAISLTSEDIALLSSFIEAGSYQTIGSVIDYLTMIGVVLSSTQEVITWESIQPELQKYIDWSFRHKEDTDSVLGLLLGSGPNIQVPESAPIIAPTTEINSMAAIMMLADVLIGVEGNHNENAHKSPRESIAHAAESIPETTAKRIQGLITEIENQTKYFSKGLIVPQIAKTLIAAFAYGCHFRVQIQEATIDASNPVLLSTELRTLQDTTKILLSIVLVHPETKKQVPAKITGGIPVMYSVKLISPGVAFGGPLYSDADAILESLLPLTKISEDGHALTIPGNEEMPAYIGIKAIKLDNKEDRTAIMHVSASILADDLNILYTKYAEDYSWTFTFLNLDSNDIQELMQGIQMAMSVSPSMTIVRMVAGQDVSMDPLHADIKIEPSQPVGETECYMQFTAIPDIDPLKLPNRIKWQWDFGEIGEKDNTTNIEVSPITAGIENVGGYKFVKSGMHNVSVRLFDASNDNFIGEETIQINVDNIVAINRTKAVRVSLKAFTKDGGFGPVGIETNQDELTWDGNKFKASWAYDGGLRALTIEGIISDDGKTLQEIATFHDFKGTEKSSPRFEKLFLVNIPLIKYGCGDDISLKAAIQGIEIQDYIKEYILDSAGTFSGFDWDYQNKTGSFYRDNIPSLEIEFKVSAKTGWH